jgi:hypothetical protein
VGLLQAFTAKEYVQTVDSTGVEGRVAVEPFTSYTVLRAQRNVNGGQLVYGAIGTGTIRDMDETRFNALHRNAFTGGADIYYRFGDESYEMSAALLGSRVEGDAQAILETQMSSARYYQRPDNTHTTLDSARTALGGYAGNFRIAKVLGFVTWEGRWVTRSPGFETNDLGFLRRADVHEQRAEVNFRWLTPGAVFRRFEIELSQNAEWTYGWERTQTGVDTRVRADFHNFWNLSLSADREFSSLSATLLRGGPAFREPGNWRFSVSGRTDFRRPVWLMGGVRHEREDASNSREWSPNLRLGIRPPGPFSLSIGFRLENSTTDRQYVSSETAGDSTYYVFGRLDRTEYSTNWRVDLAITPRLSLELYAEPFISHGEYMSFKAVRDPKAEAYGARFDPLEADRLQRAGSGGDVEVDMDRDGNVDLTFEEPNFKVVSLRTNAVVRWEFRPGSTLFLVWQQNRFDMVDDGSLDYVDAFTAPGSQLFMVKLAYWLGT